MSASHKIQRAILSVTDKAGLVEFAQKLSSMQVELVSTGARPSCCEIRASS